jgi:hypothetical protein
MRRNERQKCLGSSSSSSSSNSTTIVGVLQCPNSPTSEFLPWSGLGGAVRVTLNASVSEQLLHALHGFHNHRCFIFPPAP